MTKTILAISVIALVAIIMVMGTVSPAMAGNHGNSPPTEVPCDELDNPSDEKSGGNADSGKGTARDKVCPGA